MGIIHSPLQPVYYPFYKWTVMSSILLWIGVKQIQIRRRLTQDITSEWSRYAQYPNARGRAAIFLSCKISILYICSQIMGIMFGSQNSLRKSLVQCSGIQFAQGLLQLGPLYIKLGQILSCRKNLLPTEWVMAMETLQDQVPAWTGNRALQLAYDVWPGGSESFHTIFQEFNTTPLATIVNRRRIQLQQQYNH